MTVESITPLVIPHRSLIHQKWSLVLDFWVPGVPRPAGSKVSGVVTKKDKTGKRVPKERPGGGWMTFTKDSSGEKGKDWRGDIQRVVSGAHAGPLLAGPLAVRFEFALRRPRKHYRTGRYERVLRDDAPRYPTSDPDTTKLVRAVEDALTNVVWVDDAQIVRGADAKDYVDWWETPGVRGRVWTEGPEEGYTSGDPDDPTEV